MIPDGAGLYLALYVGTLVVHVALVSYVLVGAGWLAVTGLAGRPDDAVAAKFRDWLPFSIGVAITAGVAPLLFVQILYQERFYTANLLLSHRWMAVVPVLIVGFYAAYAAKSARLATWPPRRRAAAASVAALCFVFVAWSWTENHLLQLRPDRWAAMYGEGAMFHREIALWPRLALWLALAAPTAATLVGWQVAGDAAALRRLRVVAWGGLAAAGGAAAWLWSTFAAPARDALVGTSAGTATAAAVVVAQLGVALAWAIVPRAPRRGLAAATVLAVGALVAGAILRERLRLPALEAVRPEALHAGGMPVFVAFLAINAVAITWCVRAALRHLGPAPTE